MRLQSRNTHILNKYEGNPLESDNPGEICLGFLGTDPCQTWSLHLVILLVKQKKEAGCTCWNM